GTLTLTTGTLLADAAGRTLANNFVFNNSGVAAAAASVNSAAGFILGSSSYNGASSGSTANSTLTFTGAGALDNITFNNGVISPTVLAVYNTTTFSGTLGGPGELVVAGPGNLVLSGTNTYAGGTVLNSSGIGLVSEDVVTTAQAAVTGLNLPG